MKEISVSAELASMEKVHDFVEMALEELGASMKTQISIDVAVDEIFSNIVYYAYKDMEPGDARVLVDLTEDGASAKVTFADHGIAYNPMEQKDPDITLSAEEREIGGLGIFMVKKTMDEMTYERKDGENILTIVRKL